MKPLASSIDQSRSAGLLQYQKSQAPKGEAGFDAAMRERARAPSAGAPNAITQLVDSVDAAQQTASAQAESLARGEGNLHETAIALEKADIQMRLLMRGREKVVQAYQEIMRMSV